VGRTAVAQIITIDRGNHNILQPHGFNRIRQVPRLFGIKRIWTTVADIAKWAAPSAYVAHDHESGSPAFEAFADIRAIRFLAHRMQMILAQDRFQAQHFTRAGKFSTNPLRLA
jgi:hypothetical protein